MKSTTKREELYVNKILYTKDGRRIGNAIIIEVSVHPTLGTIYKLKTDYGNTCVHTEKEIKEHFYLDDNDLTEHQLEYVQDNHKNTIIKF